MPRLDPEEAEIMKQCQRGVEFGNGFTSGGFCRKAALCREEGRCHFVAQAELHEFMEQLREDRERRGRAA